MSAVLAQLKSFTLSSRTLFIKCVPAPRNFYERRAVLAALQKTSQQSIEMFKKLQDNSSFIAVTTRPEAAVALLEQTPLERTMVAEGANGEEPLTQATWSDASGPIATPANPLPTEEIARSTPAAADLGLSYKSFTLHIFPANVNYDHREEVMKNPLHGQWPGNGSSKTEETFISAALRKVVPSGAMAPALRDWETGGQLGHHDVDGFADNHGSEGAASLLLGKKRLSSRESFLLERIRRRGAERETPRIMKGLVQFAEECRAGSAKSRPASVSPQARSRAR